MSNDVLMDASHQWASRPKDERYNSLEELYQATKAIAARSGERLIPVEAIRVEADGGRLFVPGKVRKAQLTHWASGQLASTVGAPASYLRKLPATLAAQCLNHGLKNMDEDGRGPRKLYLTQSADGSRLDLRAITGPDYARIPHHRAIERWLAPIVDSHQWEPAPPAMDGSRGLYAGDRDMFAFLVSPNRIDDGTEQGIGRGLVFYNSDVGAGAIYAKAFGYRFVCGNHMIWGVQDLAEVRFRHVGRAASRFDLDFKRMIRRYLEQPASVEEEIVKVAQATRLGKDQETTIAAAAKRTQIPANRLVEAYKLADRSGVDGSPDTVWGLVQGLTRLSQKRTHAGDRMALDRAAGRLLRAA